MPRLALRDQFLDRSRDVLDRHVGIDAVLVEKINGLDPEAPERAFDRLPDPRRPAGDAAILPRHGIDVEAELGGDDDAVPERAQSRADDFLVLKRPIDLGGVEEGHALVDRGADERDSFVFAQLRRIAEADPHAPKPDGRDFQTAFTK